MDEQNVHHFWGISPAVDLASLIRPDGSDRLVTTSPVRILQVASYDARHSIQTLCRAARHAVLQGRPLHLYVHEEEPEALARHMLLLAVLLGGAREAGLAPAARGPLLGRERAELLLELHGNSLLRQRTATHLDRQGRLLEQLVTALSAGTQLSVGDDGLAQQRLGGLMDVSHLKHTDRDALVATFLEYREQNAFDMVKSWDTRCRKWYGDRYDFRRNMIDWDYHMRLMPLGTPGQDTALGSIIHFHHFRYWRMHGIAYELRDSVYNQPNRSLISTAYGRTREFKDRNGKDVGRSVSARGLWADILNGPYHCFGTVTEEASFYTSSNKQFSHTAMDVAAHNAQALLTELRLGKRPDALQSAPRAKAARGPTSMEDLESEAEKDASKARALAASSSESAADAADKAAAAATSTPLCTIEEEVSHLHVATPGADLCIDGAETACDGDGSDAGHAATGATDAAEAEAGAMNAVQQKMHDEDAALRAEECALDAAAWEHLKTAKVILLTGDLAKQVTGRAKYAASFDVISVGHRHVHLVGPDHGLNRVAAPNAGLLVESAHYLLQLKKELGDQFAHKVHDMAGAAGWLPAVAPEGSITDAHLLFHK